jgi:hypothetical protein
LVQFCAFAEVAGHPDLPAATLLVGPVLII